MKFRDKQIAAPKSWEKFEDLCLALFKAVWGDSLAQKNGRRGQPQYGVDIFGSPNDDRALFHGVQCKGKDQNYGRKAAIGELKAEIAKADGFSPPLEHWVFATTAPVDGKLQRAARKISQERAARGAFTVTVLGWEDIQGLLAEHSGVLEEFYPEHAFDIRSVVAGLKNLPTGEDVRALLAHLIALRQHGFASSGSEEAKATKWTLVRFENGRDLGPALMGRPLGPADAAACPVLPEVEAIVLELQRAYSVRLVGEPGAGKSVCALQAARTFATKGWRILRLVDPASQHFDLAREDDAPQNSVFDRRRPPDARVGASCCGGSCGSA